MKAEEKALPEGWVEARFQDVAQVDGGLVDPSEHQDARHVAPNHIESWTGQLNGVTTVAEDGVTSGKYRFRQGQVLYSKIRPYLAKAALAPFDGLCSADMYPVTSEIEPRFLLNWILTRRFTELASGQQGRTVLPKINRNALDKLPVPVAPLAEQRRIVEKIEALTARSRRAREALEALPALLDRYRASVLAAAFRGDLTKDWRAEHGAAQADPRAAFELGHDAAPDAAEAPVHLPQGWGWARLEEVADVKGGLAKGKKRRPEAVLESVPYLRVANVQRGFIDLSEVKEIPATAEEIGALALRRGDILFNEGGDRDKLGRGWVWEGQMDRCIHQNHVFRARLRVEGLNPYLLSMYGNAFGQAYFFGAGTQSVNLASISLSKLRAFPVPLIPEAEQAVLLERLNRALSWADALRARLTDATDRLSTLDQSILAKAFRGELVPQDPTDEPASALLDRIRARRAAEGPAPKRGRRKTA